jgi:hypothetical protein
MFKQALIRLIVFILLQGTFFTQSSDFILVDNTIDGSDQAISIELIPKIIQSNSSADLTAPNVTSPADINYLVNTTGHFITWYIADENPGNYSIFHNYLFIDTERNKTWSENGSINISVDNLPIGVHIYSIRVEDFWGNEATDNVLVTVRGVANTPTFDFTNTDRNNFPDFDQMLFISAISSIIIILMIFGSIRYRRRRKIQDLISNLPPEDPLELETLNDANLL